MTLELGHRNLHRSHSCCMYVCLDRNVCLALCHARPQCDLCHAYTVISQSFTGSTGSSVGGSVVRFPSGAFSALQCSLELGGSCTSTADSINTSKIPCRCWHSTATCYAIAVADCKLFLCPFLLSNTTCMCRRPLPPRARAVALPCVLTPPSTG